MERVQVKRWIVLFAALAATLAAIAYPVEDEVQMAPVSKPVLAPAAVIKHPEEVLSAGAIDWVASDVDPFASHGWQAPPPAPPPEQARVVQAVVAAPVEPPPPPFPYQFIGQMNDGSDRVVYLGRGDQVQLARQGDVLDGTYKVVSVTQTQIEFELMSSGLKQWLAIPAQDN
jgi:hypothetical protein